MTLVTAVNQYYRLSRRTVDYMHLRKTEFLTEIILSVAIVGVTIERGGAAEFAVGGIAMIHSFNVARAIEAYKQAKVQTEENAQTMDEYR